MPDPHGDPLRILIVDDRPVDLSRWKHEAARLEMRFDARIDLRLANGSASLHKAILEGGWTAVLCARTPVRLSVGAVLAMTQVLEPAPAVLLYGDLDRPDAHRDWLVAALATHGAVPRSGDARAGGPMAGDANAVEALHESEARFRTLTEIAPVGIFLTDHSHACVYVNERWAAITGVAAQDAEGRDWRTTLDMDADTLKATSLFENDPSQPLAFECRIDRDDGSVTWVIGQMRPYLDDHGGIVGHLGVITDITDRKAAELSMRESEKRLRDLAKHMTSAEERQRASIAREIHDDIGSSLTGMKIDVMRLRQLTAGDDEAQDKLAAFTRLLDSAAASSIRIAKALRPGILDDGIVPAIDWQLREFAKRMDIDAEFTEPEREPKLSADQSIALFRVVQEALNNVAKHAQAKHVDVVMFAQGDELTLEIRDDGRGLSQKPAVPRTDRRGGGFGITGMRERILSLGGWMDITGAPGRGTTVMCGIPMERRA